MHCPEEEIHHLIKNTLTAEIEFLQRQCVMRKIQLNPVDMAEFEMQVRKQLIGILLDCAGIHHT